MKDPLRLILLLKEMMKITIDVSRFSLNFMIVQIFNSRYVRVELESVREERESFDELNRPGLALLLALGEN